MSTYTEELVVVIWLNGEEETMTSSEAKELSKVGEISFKHRRKGIGVYAENSAKSKTTELSLPRHWIKDRGVVGGKYHTPYTPNGHHAQFMLVR